ncbi:MAG TPA: iron-containing redox enzyme family protein [Candidatus Polarisedimenticolaceae bacterium]|nr:iron-containing redox enzyme family protein [Candidatus Polarisedimenticolaceae bacterium]
MLRGITRHRAVDNDFYRTWMTRRFDIDALEVFARNYGAWVKAFPDALAVLILSTDDFEAKGEYVKTLYSEMGYGQAAKAHWVLLDAFLAQLAEKLGHASRLDRRGLEQRLDLLPTTVALIHGERELYASGDRAFGAQLALEWQAYTMLRQLYDGARNYIALWDEPDTFHECCEYFYVHIGAAEKDHKDESLHAVRRYARDAASIARIVEGYERHLELIADFWDGLHGQAARVAA